MKTVGRTLLMLALGVCLRTSAHAFVTYKDTVHSDILDKDFAVAVMVPLEYIQPANAEKHYPVLYALHGQGDGNYTFWTDVLAFKQRIMYKPMIVAMFNAKYSLYAAETEFFFQEWIPWVEDNYRCLSRGSSRAITGFSSGGFGAVHYTLYAPEKFSCVLPMSGAVEHTDGGYNVIQRFKDSIDVRDDVPPVIDFCGTEDFLYSANVHFTDSLNTWGHDYEFITASGSHDGTYWSATCPSIVDYAWDHFDTSQVTGIHEPGVPQAVLNEGSAVYYNCLGSRVMLADRSTGILIGTDGKAVVKRLRIR